MVFQFGDLPNLPIESVIDHLGQQEKGFELSFDPINGCNYLFDEDGIQKMLTWINEINN